jgi:hypothetical protein
MSGWNWVTVPGFPIACRQFSYCYEPQRRRNTLLNRCWIERNVRGDLLWLLDNPAGLCSFRKTENPVDNCFGQHCGTGKGEHEHRRPHKVLSMPFIAVS